MGNYCFVVRMMNYINCLFYCILLWWYVIGFFVGKVFFEDFCYVFCMVGFYQKMGKMVVGDGVIVCQLQCFFSGVGDLCFFQVFGNYLIVLLVLCFLFFQQGGYCWVCNINIQIYNMNFVIFLKGGNFDVVYQG